MPKKPKNPSQGGGTDLLDRPEDENIEEKPPRYNVWVANDDVTPGTLVCLGFMQVFKLSQAEAQARMMRIHTHGRGIVRSGMTKEVAETKVAEMKNFLKEWPFNIWAEKVGDDE